MLRSIILFRHGKSDWNANYESDHNRPVSKRGTKAAKKMGRYLSNIDQVPDLIISSTALRARNTAEIAINAGKWSSKLVLEKQIYESNVETLISIISKQSNEYNSICLVGHEPTFSSFIERCNNSTWSRFPTASMAQINFNINSWYDIDLKFGSLVWLIRPKELNQ
tara:strand:- start:829 stop:1326 length:498 start_codon:yes stop_codon:yes gene_type:complete